MPSIDVAFPVLSVAAWSSTGKTTLLTALLPRLREAGLRVGVIKHAHHDFDIDKPGKDSYRLREAGAMPMLVASHKRYALMTETFGLGEPDLVHLLSLMAAHAPDLVIVEGFKQWPLPKLVLYRDGIGDASIVESEHVVAVALKGAAPKALAASIPRLNLDNIGEIARWTLDWTRAHRDERTTMTRGNDMQLTHLNAQGEAAMVDIGDKQVSRREAVASGRIVMAPATLKLLSEGELPKGDVLATARIAGIQAAKRTSELIPLCHSLSLDKVSVDFVLDSEGGAVNVEAFCRLSGRTGVEMEALTAVSVACLTLYDMCKAVDKAMRIEAIQLESKRGGVRGEYQRERAPIVTGEGNPGEVSLGERCAVSPCVRVKFLAGLREQVGQSDLSLSIDELASRDVAGLKALLAERDTRFAALTDRRTLCAINQVMANDAAPITDEDEIAFFPPVTGG